MVTSVTSGRPGRWETVLGVYEFRHAKIGWLHGYRQLDLGAGQRAFVATPEKALLDLIYLQPGGDDLAYLTELRLQSLERLDLDGWPAWPTRAAAQTAPRRSAHHRPGASGERGVRDAVKDYRKAT